MDIKGYFDNIQHSKLIDMVSLRISDRRVIKLIRKWLEGGVMVDGVYERTVVGTPQGGVISPLLSNIYLHYLDEMWQRKCRSVKYPRYYFLNRWPSQKSMVKVRAEIKRMTSYRRMKIRDVCELVPELNRLLRGWSGYFKSGNAARKFSQIESYVWQRLVIFQNRRRGQKRPHRSRKYTYEWFRNLGVYQLTGRIVYLNPVYSKA